jgi:hypothetical protein
MIAAPFSLVAMALLFQDLKKSARPRNPSGDFWQKIALAFCGLGLLVPAYLAIQTIPLWRGQAPQLQAQIQSWMTDTLPTSGSNP